MIILVRISEPVPVHVIQSIKNIVAIWVLCVEKVLFKVSLYTYDTKDIGGFWYLGT